MTFLAVSTLILLLILLIVFIMYKNETSEKIETLVRQTEDIRRYLRSYEIVNPNAAESKIPKPETLSESNLSNQNEAEPVIMNEQKNVVSEEIQNEIIIDVEKEFKNTQSQIFQTKADTNQSQTQTNKPEKPKKDWEKLIGENLLVKIAVVVLVLGVSFLIKWAIDNEWINEIGRIAIGFAAGAILMTLGYLSRKNYTAFSSVLTGGGLASFYVSVSFGFQLYHLFSQSTAFILLIIITASAVAMALAYNKKELAIFAILGGFSSPFMVSTGQGNYIVLFTYILILDLGMLSLAYFKKWNFVNIISLVATLILYGAWLGSTWYDEHVPYRNALIFASAFFLIFFLMFIISNLRSREKFSAFEMLFLLLTTFCYYVAGMFIIHEMEPNFKGLFTAGLAIFNLAFLFPLYIKNKVDFNLIFLLAANVVAFLSLTAPVQFNGQYITLFWASESVVLLWISQKSGMKLLRITSVLVFFLTAGSLLMDWYQIYIYPPLDAKPLPILFNKGFITSLAVIISMILNFRLLKNDTYIPVFSKFQGETFKLFNILFILIFMYFALLLEFNYQFNQRISHSTVVIVYTGFYNFVYLTSVLIWAGTKKYRIVFNITAGMIYFAMLMFLIFYGINYSDLLSAYINDEILTPYYLIHLLTAIIAVSGGILVVIFYSAQSGFDDKISKILLWVSIILTLVIFSKELMNIALISNKNLFAESKILNSTLYSYYDIRETIFDSVYRIRFPILWGVCAFVLMIFGMIKDIKDLRIISLALVFVTLGKLLLIDVWEMSQVGRVISFISLGLILLVVAFLYQKLKKIVMGESEEKESTDKND